MALTFSDTKPKNAGRPRHLISDEDMQALRDNPGKWAVVCEATPSPGSFQPYRKLGFEVSRKSVGRRQCDETAWNYAGIREVFEVSMSFPKPVPVVSDETEVFQRYTEDLNVSITTKGEDILKVTTWATGVEGSTNRITSEK